MYTKERWEELSKKRRKDLPFEHLFWLSRYDPKPTDGRLLEELIDRKVQQTKTSLDKAINPM